MTLFLAVFYFVAVIQDQNQKLTIMAGLVLKSAKRVFGIPDFKYYALVDGLSNIFSRFPGPLRKNRKYISLSSYSASAKFWGNFKNLTFGFLAVSLQKNIL
jgi:hypothetical protein